MMISTRGRYALRVMLDLADHMESGHTPMKDVAERQGLSLKYLERILPVLTKSGMVVGVQGKGGGYRLTKAPEEYRIGEILRLTEGGLSPVECAGCTSEPCDRAGECRTMPLWAGLTKVVNEYLDGITLKDLMDGDVR
jgi:Rrf2 family protein